MVMQKLAQNIVTVVNLQMNLGLAVNKKKYELNQIFKFGNVNHFVIQCSIDYSNYQNGMVEIVKFPYVK